MDDHQQTPDGREVKRRRFGRARIFVVIAVVCVSALVLGEQVGAAPSFMRPPVSRFAVFQPRPPRPPLPVPTTGPAIPAPGVDANAVLAQAQGAADSAVGRANAVSARSGTAAQIDFRAVVCPIILRAAATVTATINQLIAQYPFLAGQLAAIRDAALARLNAMATQFGCNISAGV